MSEPTAPPANATTNMPANPQSRPRTSIVDLLEHGDGIAHVLIGILLLVLALGVLADCTYAFIRDMPEAIRDGTFLEKSLTYLSSVLLGVIILELLSTILTYIRARKLEATVKDFLIVGLISSVRKILLIGAEASLEKVTGDSFIKEAIGTVISIVGILLLIGGLLLLDRRQKANATDATADATADD